MAGQEYGISFFSEELQNHLEVEPKELASRFFLEKLGFFLTTQLPNTYEKICSAKEKPVFYQAGETERGIVGLLVVDKETLVVKTSQSGLEELEIALELGEKGLSPRLYEATPDIFTEEYISDPPLRKYVNYPFFIGYCMGRILRTMHEEGVVYGDRLIVSDHARVGIFPQPRVRIIDLGTARKGDDFQEDWEPAREELEYFYEDCESREQAIFALNRWCEKD